MFATTTVRFALVAAVVSSLTSAAPIFNLGRKEAVAMVRRAENDGQLAQGTNYFFSTLHLEDACAPGQVACVSGNYATCSGEGNWEISPCTSGSTCLATPASSPSGISIQCTSQETAQSSIQNAGGNPNTIAADFHVTDAPFSAATVPDPSASSSSAAPTATETASPTDVPSESASATEATESSSSTCIPDEEEGDGTIADGPTDTASSSAPTETPEPSSTCTDEPIETEVITVIVVPVPSQSGVYSTTTLFPEATATVVGTEVPVPSPTESSSEAASESAPAESSSSQDPSYTEPAATEYSSEEPAPTESSSESAPTDSSSEASAPTESSSSSESAATVTTIILEPGYSIPALPTGAGGASTPVAIPIVSVVGTHNVPTKRMVRVLRR